MMVIVFQLNVMIYGQSEIRFFYFNFYGNNGWNIDNFGYGINTYSSSSNCPLNGYCWNMNGDSLASRIISTSNYHSIRIVIGIYIYIYFVYTVNI